MSVSALRVHMKRAAGERVGVGESELGSARAICWTCGLVHAVDRGTPIFGNGKFNALKHVLIRAVCVCGLCITCIRSAQFALDSHTVH